jgi:hypothetical protein
LGKARADQRADLRATLKAAKTVGTLDVQLVARLVQSMAVVKAERMDQNWADDLETQLAELLVEWLAEMWANSTAVTTVAR